MVQKIAKYRRIIMGQSRKNSSAYRLGAVFGLFGCVVMGFTILACQPSVTISRKPNTGNTDSGDYGVGGLEATAPNKVMLTIPLVKSSGQERTLMADKDEIKALINYYMLIAVDDADKTNVYDYIPARFYSPEENDPSLKIELIRQHTYHFLLLGGYVDVRMLPDPANSLRPVLLASGYRKYTVIDSVVDFDIKMVPLLVDLTFKQESVAHPLDTGTSNTSPFVLLDAGKDTTVSVALGSYADSGVVYGDGLWPLKLAQNEVRDVSNSLWDMFAEGASINGKLSDAQYSGVLYNTIGTITDDPRSTVLDNVLFALDKSVTANVAQIDDTQNIAPLNSSTGEIAGTASTYGRTSGKPQYIIPPVGNDEASLFNFNLEYVPFGLGRELLESVGATPVWFIKNRKDIELRGPTALVQINLYNTIGQPVGSVGAGTPWGYFEVVGSGASVGIPVYELEAGDYGTVEGVAKNRDNDKFKIVGNILSVGDNDALLPGLYYIHVKVTMTPTVDGNGNPVTPSAIPIRKWFKLEVLQRATSGIGWGM
jgi:hypothetical protein